MNTTNGKNSVQNEDGIEAKIMAAVHSLGDLVERGGEKIESAGFKKIGEAIYELGNKIEHMGEGRTAPKAGLKTDSADQVQSSTNRSQGV